MTSSTPEQRRADALRMAAMAEAGKRGEVREFGTIANTPTALKALTSKLARSGAALRFLLRSQAMRPGTAAWLSRRR